ncbi:MAG: hypothetical protein WBQ03_23590 [Candidatus Sulfotelmatobacter sp.]
MSAFKYVPPFITTSTAFKRHSISFFAKTPFIPSRLASICNCFEGSVVTIKNQNVWVSLGRSTRCLKPAHLRHYKIHQREMSIVEMKCLQGMQFPDSLANDNPFRTLL